MIETNETLKVHRFHDCDNCGSTVDDADQMLCEQCRENQAKAKAKQSASVDIFSHLDSEGCPL